MSSESLSLSDVALLAATSCKDVLAVGDNAGFVVPDGAPDEHVGDEEVEEGDDPGGDEASPVEVVEDVGWVLPQLRDVVVHHLKPARRCKHLFTRTNPTLVFWSVQYILTNISPKKLATHIKT